MRAAQEQRFQEEQLRRREQELAEREMDIVERELHLLMSQLSQEKPRVRKRKGNFKRSRLLKLREGSSHISLPSGTSWFPECLETSWGWVVSIEGCLIHLDNYRVCLARLFSHELHPQRLKVFLLQMYPSHSKDDP